MKPRLLIVDDDINTRDALAKLLMEEGYFVQVCDDGARALSLLRTDSYDVLLTDLVMPGMNGLALVSAAKALCDQLCCIVISGHQRAAELPAEVVWHEKPLDLDQLLMQLAAATRR